MEILNLDKMSVQELKAFQYDQIVQMENLNRAIQLVHQELAKRTQQTTLTKPKDEGAKSAKKS